MRKILKIAGNELKALFYSPVAWFILVIFVFQAGSSGVQWLQAFLRQQFLGDPIEYSITTALLTGMTGMFTAIQQNLYLYIPLLTMGLMSRELGSGSVKLLYSSPVTAGQIVWGKFISMMVYGLLLVGVLLVINLFVACIVPSYDFGLLFSGLLGLFLLMCAYASIGLYMSCQTSYQVVAAMGTLAVLIVLNFIGEVGQSVEFVREITYWLSIKGRATQFINGLVCSEDLLYFVIVIAFFLTLSIMKIEGHRAKRSRWVSIGRYCAVVAVVVAAGYLTSRPGWLLYHDMTADKTQTLTKDSQDILANMKGDLTITTYVNLLGVNSTYGMPERVKGDMENFKQYIRFKSNIELKYVYYYLLDNENIRVRYPGLSDREVAMKYTDIQKLNIDMFLSPEEIKKQIDLAPEGYRFVRQLTLDNGEKVFLRLFEDQLVFPREAEISAAMKRLIVKPPKVAFLTGHGERDVNNVGDRDYFSFANNKTFRYALINQGFDVISLDLSRGGTIPVDVDILVIADMRIPFTEQEQQAFDQYIARGGNLIIAGEPGRQAVMNPLVEPFGVRFMPGMLVQPTKDFNVDLIQCDVTKAAAEMTYAYERLLKKKNKITMPGAVGLDYTTDKGFRVQPILTTADSGCWNEPSVQRASELKDPLSLGTGIVGQAYPTALALDRQSGGKEQRIIILGDADCISNAELMMFRKGIDASNYSLITESFRWLSGGEFPINTRRPDPRDTSVSMELPSMIWVRIGFLGVFPLCFIVCGIVVGYRRKKR